MNPLTLEQYALLADIAASCAVVISLIYLALQIRGQSRLNRTTTVANLTTQWSDLMKALEQDADLSELWMRGLQRWDSLNPVEKLRFSAFGGRFLANSEGLYLHRIDHTLDRRLWRGVERRVSDVVAHTGFQGWWETRRHWYSDEFQSFIDGIIEGHGEAVLYKDYNRK